MIYDTQVPSYGPKDAKVMVVGESPGHEEVEQGRPFVGRAGSLLARYIEFVGIPWSSVFRANLSRYRPRSNDFTLLLNTPQLEEGLALLSQDIEEVSPNVIVALGNWPMYYLTGLTGDSGKPGTGISQWRGSVVLGTGQFVPSAQNRKILITYHPAYIIRPQGFEFHPIFKLDLKRIPQEWDSPEYSPHTYEELIDPPNIEDVVSEFLEAEWLSVDIETFGDTLACIGFADSIHRGLCVTFENPNLFVIAKTLLLGPPKKIFQFGAYDITYLKWFYDLDVKNYAFDTYIAAANLMPELKRGLDFLTSVYTRIPYYKSERKVWKNSGDPKMLWSYNIKDVIATYWIAMEQMEELKELYR